MTLLELDIIIITTKDVKVSDFNGTSDTYLKFKTTKTKKTFTFPSLINPVLNQKFNYKTKVNEIITFKLYNYYFINKDDSLRESKLKLTIDI